MFPYGNLADALSCGNLLVGISLRIAEAEDTLLLPGHTAYDFLDFSQTFIFGLFVGRLSGVFLLHPTTYFLVPQALQATVADTREQILLFRARQQHQSAVQQTLEDVAADILALLLVEEDGTCHPEHPGVVLHEQPLYLVLFHCVFFYRNTPQPVKRLTRVMNIVIFSFSLYRKSTSRHNVQLRGGRERLNYLKIGWGRLLHLPVAVDAHHGQSDFLGGGVGVGNLEINVGKVIHERIAHGYGREHLAVFGLIALG